MILWVSRVESAHAHFQHFRTKSIQSPNVQVLYNNINNNYYYIDGDARREPISARSEVDSCGTRRAGHAVAAEEAARKKLDRDRNSLGPARFVGHASSCE